MSSENQEEMDEEQQPDDNFYLVKGTRSNFYDYIGGVSTGARLKEIVIISDKVKGKFPYAVYRDWINTEEGMVICPHPHPNKDDQSLKWLIRERLPARTTKFTMNGKAVTVRWKEYCLKSLYKHYDISNLDDAFTALGNNEKFGEETTLPDTDKEELGHGKRKKNKIPDAAESDVSFKRAKVSEGPKDQNATAENRGSLIGAGNLILVPEPNGQPHTPATDVLGNNDISIQIENDLHNYLLFNPPRANPHEKVTYENLAAMRSDMEVIKKDVSKIKLFIGGIWSFLKKGAPSDTSVVEFEDDEEDEIAVKATPEKNRIRLKLKFPIPNEVEFKKLDELLKKDETNTAFDDDTYKEVKIFIKMNGLQKNVHKIWSALLASNFASVLSIKTLEKSAMYEIVRRICVKWKDILPAVKSKESEELWDKKNKNEQFHDSTQRWLRSKQEFARNTNKKSNKKNMPKIPPGTGASLSASSIAIDSAMNDMTATSSQTTSPTVSLTDSNSETANVISTPITITEDTPIFVLT
ncbi:uncharacterized protein LOC135849488 isoform X2 [Planococcus citri]|uniref:uncharacterized protein LOC135840001 isoform X2 n=1 Tax=Planococcus citri TaxID=170843 RepID=UPI0031F952B7